MRAFIASTCCDRLLKGGKEGRREGSTLGVERYSEQVVINTIIYVNQLVVIWMYILSMDGGIDWALGESIYVYTIQYTDDSNAFNRVPDRFVRDRDPFLREPDLTCSRTIEELLPARLSCGREWYYVGKALLQRLSEIYFLII